MAGPFAYFRKNQRIWMAAAVFIAIVAFIIAPAIEQFTSASRFQSADNTLMATWNGGSLSRDQMYQEYNELRLANQFLRKLATDVRAKGGIPNVPGVSADLNQLGITSALEPPERIVERKLMSAEAARRGIVFNEDSVKTFLRRFVDGKIDGDQIQKTLFESTQGRLSWFEFNRLMCEELAKNSVLHLWGTGLRYEERRDSMVRGYPPLSTPGKNWQDFLRFNQAVKIAAYPVFAKDFESQVKTEPTERELQALYQEGRDIPRTERTIATQPAFMRTKKADFEYVSIDMDKVIQEQIALIPEETLRSEYDRRVEAKDFRVPIQSETPKVDLPDPLNEDAQKRPPALEDPSTAKPADSSSNQNVPITPANSGEVPASAPATPAANPPAAPAESPTEKPTASRNAHSGVRFVSYQEPSAPQNESKAPEATSNENQSAEKPVVDAKTTPANSIELSDAPATPSIIPSAAQTPGQEAESTPMRTKTFEEVKDQIARDLARAAAIKEVENRVSLLLEPMNMYKSELNSYAIAVKNNDRSAVAPERPNLKEIAMPLGFEYGTTGKIDAETAVRTPIGSSFIMSAGSRQFLQFAQLINASIEEGETFFPLTSRGFSPRDQQFVFWKTEEVPPVTPALETIRNDVKEVWKKQQAFKLASEKAKEISLKVGANALEESLDADASKLIATPASFTWFNPMFARMESQLQLSTVELLQPVDNSFMETVFSHKVGDTTVASDAGKSIVYVIKILDLTPVESLYEKFAASPVEGVANVARIESDRAFSPWYQNIKKQVGFKSVLE